MLKLDISERVLTLVCACFIVGLEVLALIKGIDGVALSIGIGALAGLGGYTVKRFIK